MENILITGSKGFMGGHLIEFLHDKGFKVFGTYFKPTTNFKTDKTEFFECDIRDKNRLKEIIKKVNPSRIYHLAAQSYPTVSWKDPVYTAETNIIGTINLFEIIKELKLKTRVLVACSSAEYGFVTEDEVPVKESRTLKPLHPYGVSKVAQENLAYQYFKNFNIHAVTVRIFNTTGPRKTNDVCSDFTERIVMIEKGKERIMKVGNLKTRRAITDVRDVIEAFWLVLEKCPAGEVYNLSGSKAYKIKDLLDIMLKNTDKKFDIVQSPELMRPTDEPIIFGDSSKVKEATGWEQKISIEKTIIDMLNHWREVL